MIAADGQAIGEITALFLDSEAWKLESLRVKLRNEVADQLGATRGMFHAGTLEIPSAWFSRLATLSSSRWLHMSSGKFCRIWATLLPLLTNDRGRHRARVRGPATIIGLCGD